MIAMLHGRLLEKGTDSVIIDVGGVAYEVFIPNSIVTDLGSSGEQARLRTHLDVKEDALQLYGFLTKDQLDVFRLLISVGKVGPRTALAVLSVMDPPSFVKAVQEEDVSAFTAVSGIGKKTAQRIILDLAEKVKKRWPSIEGGEGLSSSLASSDTEEGVWKMARNALLAQGFKPSEAEERLAWARAELGEDGSIQNILKEALRFES